MFANVLPACPCHAVPAPAYLPACPCLPACLPRACTCTPVSSCTIFFFFFLFYRNVLVLHSYIPMVFLPPCAFSMCHEYSCYSMSLIMVIVNSFPHFWSFFCHKLLSFLSWPARRRSWRHEPPAGGTRRARCTHARCLPPARLPRWRCRTCPPSCCRAAPAPRAPPPPRARARPRARRCRTFLAIACSNPVPSFPTSLVPVFLPVPPPAPLHLLYLYCPALYSCPAATIPPISTSSFYFVLVFIRASIPAMS